MRASHFPTADEAVLGWDFKEARDGGKGPHQAIACARLGLPTHFVGRAGQDRLGETGAQWMSDASVNLTYLCRSDRTATGCGFVMINPQGVPAITTALGANAEFSTEDVDSVHWTRPFKGSEERKARSACNQATNHRKEMTNDFEYSIQVAHPSHSGLGGFFP
jgi:sugar/nucleoside kinase (ribokinase family)